MALGNSPNPKTKEREQQANRIRINRIKKREQLKEGVLSTQEADWRARVSRLMIGLGHSHGKFQQGALSSRFAKKRQRVAGPLIDWLIAAVDVEQTNRQPRAKHRIKTPTSETPGTHTAHVNYM